MVQIALEVVTKMNRISVPYHAKAYLCIHVALRERPVLLVDKTDGDWQFLCGEDHHSNECHVAGIGHLVDMDPSLAEVLDLPDNFEASRSAVGSPWVRSKSS